MIENPKSNLKLLLTFLVCIGLFKIASGLHEFPVYRLIAYEENGQTFGSKIPSFNLVGSHFSGDLLRKLAIIHFSEINNESLSALLGKKIAGLLIILPQTSDAQESNTWEAIYDKLVSKTTSIPVYLCWENDIILEFYEKSRASLNNVAPSRHERSDIESSMNFIISSSEPKLSKTVSVEDFYGVLDESTPLSKVSGVSSPIILVISSYDSFTFVPDANLGVSKYTSGAIALMNVAKHLSTLYELNNQNLRYNIVYYLTSSKAFKYEGLQTWLNKAETSKVVSRIEYALLLDSISSEKTLNLATFNEDTNKDAVENALRLFNRLSKAYNLTLNVERTGQHFLNKKFPIIKISDEKANQNTRNWISTKNFNRDAITKASLFLTEFFVSSIYNITKDYQILDKSNLNHNYLDGLIDLFSLKPTFPLQITKESVLSQEIFRAFSDATKHANRISYSYSSPQFYSSNVAQLKIAKINSPFFDFYLFVINIAWLSVLYFILNKSSKVQDSKKK